MSAAVVSTSVIGSRRRRSSATSDRVRHLADRLAEATGVGKDERGVESVDHQPGQPRRVRIALGVVHASDPLDATELGLVRPPGAAEHIEDGQPHRDEDAGQDAQEGNAEQAMRDRRNSSGAAATGDASRRRRSATRRRDDDGTKVGWGTYRMSELAKSRTTAITTAPTIR